MTERNRSFAITAALLLAVATVSTLAAIASAGGSSSTNVAKRATARYHDLATATHAGYGVLKDKNGVTCIAMDDMPAMGAMGVHYVKPALVADGAIRATAPEALVYEPAGDGKLQLVAVEYVVLKSAWDARHTKPPALFGHRFNFTPAGNRFGLPPYYSLHAWLWKYNPSGQFSMWNPTVTCPAKGG